MAEADILKDYDPADYDRSSVAVDLVLMGIRDSLPAALLLWREEHPHAGRRALPGGSSASTRRWTPQPSECCTQRLVSAKPISSSSMVR